MRDPDPAPPVPRMAATLLVRGGTLLDAAEEVPEPAPPARASVAASRLVLGFAAPTAAAVPDAARGTYAGVAGGLSLGRFILISGTGGCFGGGIDGLAMLDVAARGAKELEVADLVALADGAVDSAVLLEGPLLVEVAALGEGTRSVGSSASFRFLADCTEQVSF